MHRRAKRLKFFAARYLAVGADHRPGNAATRRGNEMLIEARAIRMRLGELPQDDITAEDTRRLLDRARRRRLSLASNAEVHDGM